MSAFTEAGRYLLFKKSPDRNAKEYILSAKPTLDGNKKVTILLFLRRKDDASNSVGNPFAWRFDKLQLDKCCISNKLEKLLKENCFKSPSLKSNREKIVDGIGVAMDILGDTLTGRPRSVENLQSQLPTASEASPPDIPNNQQSSMPSQKPPTQEHDEAVRPKKTRRFSQKKGVNRKSKLDGGLQHIRELVSKYEKSPPAWGPPLICGYAISDRKPTKGERIPSQLTNSFSKNNLIKFLVYLNGKSGWKKEGDFWRDFVNVSDEKTDHIVSTSQGIIEGGSYVRMSFRKVVIENNKKDPNTYQDVVHTNKSFGLPLFLKNNIGGGEHLETLLGLSSFGKNTTGRQMFLRLNILKTSIQKIEDSMKRAQAGFRVIALISEEETGNQKFQVYRVFCDVSSPTMKNLIRYKLVEIFELSNMNYVIRLKDTTKCEFPGAVCQKTYYEPLSVSICSQMAFDVHLVDKNQRLFEIFLSNKEDFEKVLRTIGLLQVFTVVDTRTPKLERPVEKDEDIDDDDDDDEEETNTPKKKRQGHRSQNKSHPKNTTLSQVNQPPPPGYQNPSEEEYGLSAIVRYESSECIVVKLSSSGFLDIITNDGKLYANILPISTVMLRNSMKVGEKVDLLEFEEDEKGAYKQVADFGSPPRIMLSGWINSHSDTSHSTRYHTGKLPLGWSQVCVTEVHFDKDASRSQLTSTNKDLTKLAHFVDSSICWPTILIRTKGIGNMF